LKIRLEGRGFNVKAAAAFIGQHTFSANIAPGRPNPDDLDTAFKFGQRTVDSLKTDGAGTLNIKGVFPYALKGATFTWHPVTTDDCIQCGQCVEGCPWAAIDAQTIETLPDSNCANCLRCIQICPVGARKVTDEKFLAYLPQFEARLNVNRREPELFLLQ